MGRRRSAIVRRASADWQGITRLNPKTIFEHPHLAAAFYDADLSPAKRLEVEIGSGNGDFIVQAAQKNPQTLFLGIEYAQKFIRLVRDRVSTAKLANVRLLCAEAKIFIRHGLPDQSVDAFHIYFPDPWPKHGQQKKRSMSVSGLSEMHRALRAKGNLFFVTDHPDYFQTVLQSLNTFDGFQTLLAQEIRQAEEGGFTAYELSTHFGRRYLHAGKPIYRLNLEKKSPV